jgi:hypothetical protein
VNLLEQLQYQRNDKQAFILGQHLLPDVFQQLC